MFLALQDFTYQLFRVHLAYLNSRHEVLYVLKMIKT